MWYFWAEMFLHIQIACDFFFFKFIFYSKKKKGKEKEKQTTGLLTSDFLREEAHLLPVYLLWGSNYLCEFPKRSILC